MKERPQYSVRASTPLEAALALAGLGVPTFPVNGKLPVIKDWPSNATTDPVQLHQWFASGAFGVGGITGRRSKYIVIDSDVKSGGPGNVLKAQLKYGNFPPCPTSRTGGGGQHYWFSYSGDLAIPNRTRLAGHDGIDVRADRGFVVVPPSPGYSWEPGLALGEIDAPEIPEAWLHLILRREQGVLPTRQTDGASIREGSRNDTLFRAACARRARGDSKEQIAEYLAELNLRCVPRLDADELMRIAESAAKYDPNFPATDLGNARRLVSRHGEDIRFCLETGKWLVWTGQNWRQDYNA